MPKSYHQSHTIRLIVESTLTKFCATLDRVGVLSVSYQNVHTR